MPKMARAQVLAQIVVAQFRALARMLVEGVRHRVGVDGAAGTVPPVVVGQPPVDHPDLEASEKAQVKIPVADHRELLVEQADLLVNGAPVHERDRRERIIRASGEQFDAAAPGR